MKDVDFAELLTDCDSLLLGIWKMFHFSPKKGSVQENVQSVYGKRHLKILKAAVTRWLTHGRASQRILGCFKKLLKTKDHICLETKKTDISGYQNMLMEHRIVFCLHSMTDILAAMNTSSSALQKQGSLLVDIKHMVNIMTDTLQKLSVIYTPSEFKNILSPRKSSYANNQHFINIISNF